MKKLLLTICTLLVMTSYAYADFYVYYDKDTKEVQFIAENQKKIHLSKEDKERLEIKKMPGRLQDYELAEAIEDYKLVGTHFIINTHKISDRINAQEQSQEKASEWTAIRKRAYKDAWIILLNEEVKFNHITGEDFK